MDSTGLHPTQDKLKAVAEAPPPRNLKELRSFLASCRHCLTTTSGSYAVGAEPQHTVVRLFVCQSVSQ